MKLPILIHRFFTNYVTGKDGTQIARDMVEYGPIGQAGRTHVVARIDEISKVSPNPGANPALQAAKFRWEFIKPKYEAWKNNQELPAEGTPLAAWNFLTQQQAEILRVNGVRSVEDVSVLSDAHFNRIPIPNLRSIAEAAKKFLDASDVNKFAAQMKEKDETINALTARIDQMAEMLAGMQQPEKRGPGRPRKEQSEEAAA